MIIIGIYLMPWHNIRWGKIELLPTSTITVVGEARGIEKNQIAKFNIGVTSEGNDKQTTIEEVNNKMTVIIQALKDFGIDERDIKTENISVNEQRRPVEIVGATHYQWYVNNSISLTLREIERASELTSVLSNTGANNIYGPNFQLDDKQDYQDDLVIKALENAKQKAEKMAKFDNKNVGKIISISENNSSNNIGLMKAEFANPDFRNMPIEVGVSETYKQLLVVFELR